MNTFEEKKNFIDNFFLFLIELNLNRTNNEVLDELKSKKENQALDRNMKFIRKLNIQAKAQINRSKFEYTRELLKKLKSEKGDQLFETLKEKLGKKEQLQFETLFRKFKSLTENDMESMLEDEKLIDLMVELEKSSDYTNEDN